MQFPFGPNQPDRGEASASVIVADNVLPILDGYGPYPSLFTPATAAALPGAPRGVFSLVLSTDSWKAYGFTASTLYELQSDFTWTQIATSYALPSGYDWSAIHFGTKLLFTNTVDGLKSYDVEAGGAISSITAAGYPAWVFSCANFVVALNCLDSLGNRNGRLIKTSGFNDQTNWASDGADYQELADGETLLSGFDLKQNTALLLQRRALVLMTFGNATGGAQFSLQKVSGGKGSVGARSCVSFDGSVYFPSDDDFYMFSLATGLVPIGANEIARTFLSMVGDRSLIQGALDPLKKVVLWRYQRASDPSTIVSEVCIGYEYNLKRWFTVTEQTSYLTQLATVAVSYDAATGTYDSQTLTYNDLYWSGSAALFGALDENYKFSLWTGPNLAATITTGTQNSPISGKILWATPVTDAVSPTLELGTKDDLSETTNWRSPEAKASSGRVPVEGRGMNIAFRFKTVAGAVWNYARGIDHVKGALEGPK